MAYGRQSTPPTTTPLTASYQAGRSQLGMQDTHCNAAVQDMAGLSAPAQVRFGDDPMEVMRWLDEPVEEAALEPGQQAACDQLDALLARGDASQAELQQAQALLPTLPSEFRTSYDDDIGDRLRDAIRLSYANPCPAPSGAVAPQTPEAASFAAPQVDGVMIGTEEPVFAAPETDGAMVHLSSDGSSPEIEDPGAQFAAATTGASTGVPYRAEMEAAFGEDFSSVRSTTGRAADLEGLGANAAASGESIAFGSSSPDKHTVAHELTHVVQERQSGGGGAPMAKSTVSQVGDASEREADAVADQVLAGEAVTVQSAPGGGISRDPWSYVPTASASTSSTDVQSAPPAVATAEPQTAAAAPAYAAHAALPGGRVQDLRANPDEVISGLTPIWDGAWTIRGKDVPLNSHAMRGEVEKAVTGTYFYGTGTWTSPVMDDAYDDLWEAGYNNTVGVVLTAYIDDATPVGEVSATTTTGGSSSTTSTEGSPTGGQVSTPSGLGFGLDPGTGANSNGSTEGSTSTTTTQTHPVSMGTLSYVATVTVLSDAGMKVAFHEGSILTSGLAWVLDPASVSQ
jgi:hypothetical protein